MPYIMVVLPVLFYPLSNKSFGSKWALSYESSSGFMDYGTVRYLYGTVLGIVTLYGYIIFIIRYQVSDSHHEVDTLASS